MQQLPPSPEPVRQDPASANTVPGQALIPPPPTSQEEIPHPLSISSGNWPPPKKKRQRSRVLTQHTNKKKKQCKCLIYWKKFWQPLKERLGAYDKLCAPPSSHLYIIHEEPTEEANRDIEGGPTTVVGIGKDKGKEKEKEGNAASTESMAEAPGGGGGGGEPAMTRGCNSNNRPSIHLIIWFDIRNHHFPKGTKKFIPASFECRPMPLLVP